MSSSARLRRIACKARLKAEVGWLALSKFDDHNARAQLKPSFSQCGEDLIAWFLLSLLGINRPSYLDIGAHHPWHLNNTALFHLLGGRGVNIEPDPALFAAFPRERPRDINLNVGIGRTAGRMTFFRMADPSLNTFSAQEAERMQQDEGIRIAERVSLPVRTINEVIREHAVAPDFVSIDVEGHDIDILDSYDFARHRPAVICVETVSFSLRQAGRKDPRARDLLAGRNYRVYADTYINTLFVDGERFAGAGETG